MIAPEQIVPTLGIILADEAAFMSKLQMIETRSKTSNEVWELEKRIQ